MAKVHESQRKRDPFTTTVIALVLTPPRLGEGRLWTAKGDMEPSTEFP